jgi:hypothetical protein
MITVKIGTYTLPNDGYDYCFSCNYLWPVQTVYVLDDTDEMVPLCKSCAWRIEGSR